MLADKNSQAVDKINLSHMLKGIQSAENSPDEQNRLKAQFAERCAGLSALSVQQLRKSFWVPAVRQVLSDGHVDYLRQLTQNIASENAENQFRMSNQGDTPLWVAIKNNQVRVIRVLLDLGYWFGIAEACICGVRYDRLECVEQLMTHPAFADKFGKFDDDAKYALLKFVIQRAAQNALQALIGTHMFSNEQLENAILFAASKEGKRCAHVIFNLIVALEKQSNQNADITERQHFHNGLRKLPVGIQENILKTIVKENGSFDAVGVLLSLEDDLQRKAIVLAISEEQCSVQTISTLIAPRKAAGLVTAEDEAGWRRATLQSPLAGKKKKHLAEETLAALHQRKGDIIGYLDSHGSHSVNLLISAAKNRNLVLIRELVQRGDKQGIEKIIAFAKYSKDVELQEALGHPSQVVDEPGLADIKVANDSEQQWSVLDGCYQHTLNQHGARDSKYFYSAGHFETLQIAMLHEIVRSARESSAYQQQGLAVYEVIQEVQLQSYLGGSGEPVSCPVETRNSVKLIHAILLLDPTKIQNDNVAYCQVIRSPCIPYAVFAATNMHGRIDYPRLDAVLELLVNDATLEAIQEELARIERLEQRPVSMLLPRTCWERYKLLPVRPTAEYARLMPAPPLPTQDDAEHEEDVEADLDAGSDSDCNLFGC